MEVADRVVRSSLAIKLIECCIFASGHGLRKEAITIGRLVVEIGNDVLRYETNEEARTAIEYAVEACKKAIDSMAEN